MGIIPERNIEPENGLRGYGKIGGSLSFCHDGFRQAGKGSESAEEVREVLYETY